MPTKVTKWEARDGSLHETEDKAIRHDARLRFVSWVTRTCKIDTGDGVSLLDAAEWFFDNFEQATVVINDHSVHEPGKDGYVVIYGNHPDYKEVNEFLRMEDFNGGEDTEIRLTSRVKEATIFPTKKSAREAIRFKGKVKGKMDPVIEPCTL